MPFHRGPSIRKEKEKAAQRLRDDQREMEREMADDHIRRAIEHDREERRPHAARRTGFDLGDSMLHVSRLQVEDEVNDDIMRYGRVNFPSQRRAGAFEGAFERTRRQIVEEQEAEAYEAERKREKAAMDKMYHDRVNRWQEVDYVDSEGNKWSEGRPVRDIKRARPIPGSRAAEVEPTDWEAWLEREERQEREERRHEERRRRH